MPQTLTEKVLSSIYGERHWPMYIVLILQINCNQNKIILIQNKTVTVTSRLAYHNKLPMMMTVIITSSGDNDWWFLDAKLSYKICQNCHHYVIMSLSLTYVATTTSYGCHKWAVSNHLVSIFKLLTSKCRLNTYHKMLHCIVLLLDFNQ